jgi:Flp pilus assembly protein TadG
MIRRILQEIYQDKQGVAAVEFAIIAPLFFLMLFGIICFSILLGTENAVEQISADAARAALGGLSPTEQVSIAQNYVSSIVGSYGIIDPTKVVVTTISNASTLSVTVTYDMSNAYIFTLGSILNSASPIISRTAAIQIGGF